MQVRSWLRQSQEDYLRWSNGSAGRRTLDSLSRLCPYNARDELAVKTNNLGAHELQS
jgi:hypothetical protein